MLTDSMNRYLTCFARTPLVEGRTIANAFGSGCYSGPLSRGPLELLALSLARPLPLASTVSNRSRC
ncbi:hypothetical protein BIW11_05145 [Tropilaelaps mercedesae]|uniref:Uncharacterized protein n=1 Tax=Tropilaelaps mercedesae TaxID=418985 RepID=A0A1V9Y3K4_9ACAR|nr:hypothetical protein BIW11_05145 [Tropilaelaps mercedesae]